MKCNVDAYFSLSANKFGIDMCLRDGRGSFIRARTQWLSPIVDVHISETMGLLEVFKWVRHMGYRDVIFEHDAKGCLCFQFK